MELVTEPEKIVLQLRKLRQSKLIKFLVLFICGFRCQIAHIVVADLCGGSILVMETLFLTLGAPLHVLKLLESVAEGFADHAVFAPIAVDF